MAEPRPIPAASGYAAIAAVAWPVGLGAGLTFLVFRLAGGVAIHVGGAPVVGLAG